MGCTSHEEKTPTTHRSDTATATLATPGTTPPGAMDILESVGLIQQAPGLWCPNGRGYQSVAWATGALVALVGPLLDVSEHRRLNLPTETIVLRSRLDKAVIDYPETADTTAMREQVAVVNEGLSRLDLRQFGKRIEIPLGRRIFNGSFQRGGRFYCHGASFRTCPPVTVATWSA